jgi:hypothetical protein
MPSPYHELVIEGPRPWTFGFIQGFLRGSGIHAPVLDAEAEGFAGDSLIERLRDLLHPDNAVMHFLVPAEALPEVRQAIADPIAEQRQVHLRSERAIAGARFEFSLAVYSPAHAARIRVFFGKLPEGVKLTGDTDFKETVDPGAGGVHSYAPAHRHELTGHGGVEGDLDGVLAVYHGCRDEELIKERDLRLIPAAESAP